MQRARQILIATDFTKTSGRDFFAGVLRYARTISNWNLTLLQSPEEFTPERLTDETARGAAGVITTTMETNGIHAALANSPLPLVMVGARAPSFQGRNAPTSLLTLDEESIGRTGASHLVDLGKFATFGFVHCPDKLDRRLSQLRALGFRRKLSEHRFLCSAFDHARDGKALKQWLVSLKKPAAVLCGHDHTGIRVLDACRAAKLKVPEQVSVLGIDNDVPLCETAAPRMSSIRIDAEAEGFAAAEELDRLLRRKRKHPNREIVYATGTEVVERGSTGAVVPAVDLFRKAMEFIQSHAHQHLSVTDVVKHLGVSRRLADLRFRQLSDSTINAAIQQARLQEAAKRLLESTASVKKVVFPLGFTDLAYFTQLFRRKFGLPPAAYRQHHRSGTPTSRTIAPASTPTD